MACITYDVNLAIEPLAQIFSVRRKMVTFATLPYGIGKVLSDVPNERHFKTNSFTNTIRHPIHFPHFLRFSLRSSEREVRARARNIPALKSCASLAKLILPFTHKISFVILLTVCCTILMMLIQRIWYRIN